MIRLAAVTAILGLGLGVNGQAFASEADTGKLVRLQEENRRLSLIIEEKNRALDLAITSIKKGFKRSPVVQHNPFMLEAVIDAGWKSTDLEGVGKVSIKPYKDLMLIRLEETDKPLLLALLGHRTISAFSCSHSMSCVVVADKDLVR